MALLDNLFGTPPEYLSGLLGQDELGGLQRKANTTGLINTALAFIAQPRNQRYGSALPYLGKALMAGQQSGQNVYENALRGFETQQKIAELKRQQEQRAAYDKALGNLYTTTPAVTESVPGGYAPAQQQVMEGQVAPNFGMTRLPDVTREVAPARRELNLQALIDLAATGDPRAANLISGMKTVKELTAPQKAELVKLGRGDVAYDPISGKYVAQGLPSEDKLPMSAQEFALAQQNPAFAEFLDRSKKAPSVTVNLPPAEKAILEVDKDTLAGLTGNANAARSIATQTKTINSLIGDLQGSGVVKLSSDLQNYLGIKSPEANVNQAISALANKAATEIRTPGSGSTSDLEFNAYRAAFPSLATSRAGRVLMGQIADANAKRMSKLADWARVQVQKGTFSYEGLAAYDDSLGSAVSDSVKKQVEALTGGTTTSGFSIRKKR